MATTTLKPPKEAGTAVKDGKKKGKKDGKKTKEGGSKKKVVIIAVAVLLVVGGGAWFFLLRGPSAPPKPQPGAVLKLDSINVNLADSHYLKLGLALQTTTKASPDLAPGYSVQMIDLRRAHVVFTGGGSRNRAHDAAMLGAAEMTLEQKGTWFRIDHEWVAADPAQDETTVALEIKFGEGPTPEETNAFDATEVAQTLRPLVQAVR